MSNATAPTNKHQKTVARIVGGFLLSIVALYAAGHFGGIRWNRTASLPTGLYRLTDAQTNIIAFCPEEPAARFAIERGYRSFAMTCADHHAALMKPIGARPGDVVAISKKGITVNGRPIPNTQQFQLDSQHRPMNPYPAGTYTVAPNTYWALSSYNKYSYDSRYFGPIQTKDVISYVAPVWTSH